MIKMHLQRRRYYAGRTEESLLVLNIKYLEKGYRGLLAEESDH